MAHKITYKELVLFYGAEEAYALLRSIEAAIHNRSNIIFLDLEKRLQFALETMDRELVAA